MTTDHEKLWQALTEEFKNFPALALAVSPQSLLEKSKDIVEQVQDLALDDQIKIARQMVWIYATRMLQLNQFKDKDPQPTQPVVPAKLSPEEAKKQRAIQIQQRKDQEKREEEERVRISEIARAELEGMISKVLTESDSLSLAQREALKYFKYIYVDGKRDPEISYLFPNTSRDQRYQWKTRAIKLIVPRVSEESRKYISERSKTKFAANDLLQAAGIFLKACLKE